MGNELKDIFFLVFILFLLVVPAVLLMPLFLFRSKTGGIERQKHQVIVEVNPKKLIAKLDIGYETKYYKLNKIPDSEIVEGKKGNYYFVDLKDAVTQEILIFMAGKYTIDSLDKNFSESITRFYNPYNSSLNF